MTFTDPRFHTPLRSEPIERMLRKSSSEMKLARWACQALACLLHAQTDDER